MTKYTLYYAPKTRSARPRWLLEELAVPYELKKLDLRKGEHKTAEYLKIHPLGLVPAMEINGRPCFESGALCMYLADLHPEKKLAPKIDDPQRMPYLQWFFYFQNNVEPSLVTIFENTLFLPENQRKPELVAPALKKLSTSLAVVELHLEQNMFEGLLPKFTAVDCFAGSMVIWAQAMKLLSDFPRLSAYADQMKIRPAWKKSIEEK